MPDFNPEKGFLYTMALLGMFAAALAFHSITGTLDVLVSQNLKKTQAIGELKRESAKVRELLESHTLQLVYVNGEFVVVSTGEAGQMRLKKFKESRHEQGNTRSTGTDS
tara:strand:+ start:36 stop:362 length:327 start_codon:yes stop_codon:yes gene_type:complete